MRCYTADSIEVFSSESSEKLQTNTKANVANGESINFINLICDSGATEHLVNTTECLSSMRPLKNQISIKSANVKAPLVASQFGNLITRLDSGKIVKIKNILFAPQLSKNLLSLRKLVQNGIDILLSSSGIKIIDIKSKKVVKTGSFDGRF